MPRAIRIHETGGPEVMRLEDVDVGAPADDEVQVQHVAIGVNFIDVYDRTGLYPQKFMPGGLGREAAGIVSAVGRKVRGIRRGDRVAYVSDEPGSYAEVRNVTGSRVVKIPAGITDEQAAVLMLKGLTACYLLRHTYRVRPGDFILVHAAAGGVGTLLSQWGKALGAVVIGVVGSEAKAKLAKRNGCRHALVRGRDPVAESVRKISKGGAHVVYDGVGKDTFTESLDSLRRRGLMVSYGSASGPVPPFSTAELVKRGSLYITRPTLFDYTAERAELDSMARDTFAALRKKWIRVRIDQRYPLADAAQAHRDLEARKTTGASVILPVQGSRGA
ncbi:MAG TPA: quinone oxidoreductase [Steroidobacteraceae bacterium]|nr:quinone oxidoreductase [Steroidobacteraceae bacterium]